MGPFRNLLRAAAATACVVAAAAALAVASSRSSAMPAAAAMLCGDPDEAAPDLFTVTPVPGSDGVIHGRAPLTVTFSIRGGVVVFPAGFVSSQLDWGDGSGLVAVAAVDCGDGESAFWPQQSLVHSYGVAGTYTATWKFTLVGTTYEAPFGLVQVDAAAAPTPVPPPAPTAAPVTPTSPPPVGATPVPQSVQSPVTTPAPSVSPDPSPSASPTATPSSTAPAGTVTAVPAAPVTSRTPENENRSEIVRALPDAGEVSTDPDVIVTNVVLAGTTVWVLFTSVLLNQVLQDNRSEVERKTAWLTAPARSLRRAIPESGRGRFRLAGRVAALAAAAFVLVLTGMIYSVLEPGFGLNQSTVVLFASIVTGVGIVTYVCSGLEALATTRIVGAPAAVRAFPATIAVAVVSVAVSRLLDLQPGVMYGFVASCAVLGPMTAGHREKGRIAIVPVIAGLVLAVGAWLAVGPIRSAAGDSDGWFPAVLEATAVVVFAGGIEGLLFNMIPIAATDGGKIYRWNRWLWAGLAVVSGFLTWHVLFGHDQAYFSGLRQTRALSVMVLFVGYTALTVGLWAYFRFRKEQEKLAPAPDSA